MIRLLSVLISFQLAFGPTLQLQAQTMGAPGGGASSGDDDMRRMSEEMAEGARNMSAKDRERKRRLGSIADELERGRVELTAEEADPDLEIGQRVRIYNGKPGAESRIVTEYDPLDLRIEAPGLAYTSLDFRIEGRDLIIEAVRGADAQGQHGVVVADLVRPNMDAVAIARDGELTSIIRRDGSVRVISMEQVYAQLFSSPISFFEVYSPSEPKEFRGPVSAKYLTRGVTPVGLDQVRPDVIVPTDPQGRPELTAGDLLVIEENGGRSEIAGIYSREVIYKRIEIRALVKAYMATMIAPDGEKIKLLENGLSEKLKNFESEIGNLETSDLSEAEKMFVSQLSADELRKLLSTAENARELRERDFDKFGFDDWAKSFNELREKAAATGLPEDRVQELEKRWQEYLGQVKNSGLSEAQLRAAEEAKAAISTSSEQRQWSARSAAMAAIKKTFQYIKQQKMTVLFLAGMATMFASPYLVEWASAHLHLQALAKFYYNYFPAVLQDAVYRVPLALSTFAIIMFWPVGVAMSALAGYAFKIADRMVAGQNTGFARQIRDLNQKWNNDAMTTWQRINTLGFRIYAFVTLSVFTRLAHQILRQKSIVTALASGLNPLTRIDPNSELGKAAGVKEPMRLGLNSPFTNQEKLRQETEIRQKAQALLVEQKNRAEARAWLAAALAVSHESGIDIATLSWVAQNGLTPEIRDNLLNNGRVTRSWYVVADQVAQMLVETGAVGLDERNEIDVAKLTQDYRIARKVADELKNQSQGRINFKLLGTSFRRLMTASTASLFTFGMKEYQFLSKVYASPMVSEMVRQQFVIDYLLTAGIPTVAGPRANLSRPHELVARADGPLWTNPAHLMEMVIQVYIYFFVAGSRYAMVYQKPHPEKESIYAPKAGVEYDPVPREQGFMATTRDMATNAVDFDRSDVGGVMVKGQIKRFNTIQGGFLMEMVGRLLIVGQSTAAAFKGWAFVWAAGPWFITIFWEFVNRGTQLTDAEIAKLNVELRNAQVKIDQALERGDVERMTEGYRQLLEMYVKYSPVTQITFKNFLRHLKGQPALVIGTSEPMQAAEDQLRREGYAELLDSHREYTQVSERSYWGLVVALSEALSAKNYSEVDRLSEALRQALLQTEGAPRAEIERMNAESLLKFSALRSPVYTKASNFAREAAVLFGAVSTTLSGLFLTVFSFRELTWSVVGLTFIGSHAVLFPLVWLVMSTRGRQLWREFKASPAEFWRSRWYGRNSPEARAREQEGRLSTEEPPFLNSLARSKVRIRCDLMHVMAR